MSLNKDKTNDKESYRYISFHEANVLSVNWLTVREPG